MIIDLAKFLQEERRIWDELEAGVDRLEQDPDSRLDLEALKRFHYLYQRASADLAKVATFSAETDVQAHLEHLVRRSYAQLYGARKSPHRLAPVKWFFNTFPQTFRRRAKAFWLALIVFIIGGMFGGMAISFDPDAKAVLMPWSHLRMSPAERVAMEEKAEKDRLEGRKAGFSSFLMTHNTQVSVLTMAFGVTYGVGTLILLFSNGVILGAVAWDFFSAGQAKFLLGWLLPHGSIEIPAILLAGQAGLVLAGALIGWGRPIGLRQRLRAITPDLVTLIFGVAVMLVWAGIVEAFLSQYHEPVLPYEAKIVFGLVELFLLVLFLSRSGRKKEQA